MRRRTEWFGEQVKREARRAALEALNDTTEKTAEQARSNHPGWKNVTGDAEASLMNEPAAMIDRKTARGRVGSTLWRYLFLELKNGSALRNAGDAVFPELPDKLRSHFRGSR